MTRNFSALLAGLALLGFGFSTQANERPSREPIPSPVVIQHGTCIDQFNIRLKMDMAQLVWQDSGAYSYRIDRRTDSGLPFEWLATTDSRYSTYLDEGLAYHVKYQYRVGEIDENSDVLCWSDVLEVTPRPRGFINSPPSIISEPPLSAVIGAPYSYSVEATDPDNDTLAYSLTLSPAGMSIDAASGLIEWIPTSDQEGANPVTVQVADPAGLSDSQSFNISVAEQNLPPQIITTSLPDALAGGSYQAQIEATDPNVGDVLTFELTTAPAGMTIESDTGNLSWLPTAADVGTADLIVRVTDNAGLFDERSFTISVQAANQPPAINSIPITEAVVGTLYIYALEATDPDGDNLTYSLTQAPSGMSIDASSGFIEWTPVSGQEGNHPITVEVADPAGLSDSQSFNISVAEQNLPPQIITTSLPDALAGQAYQTQIEATDPNSGDVLTFELTAAPAGMTIESDTGNLSWLPSEADAGSVSLTVRVADDEGLFDEQNFNITVQSANQAPVINSTPITEAVVGTQYSYAVQATDPDGDTLSYSLTQSPSGMSIDTATGLIEWTPASGQKGTHPVTVEVADPAGLSDRQSFSINVAEQNLPPQITTTSLPDALAGQPYQTQIEATDPNSGDVLTFELTAAPTGMSINDESGIINWLPTAADVGTADLTVRVTDNAGLFDERSFTIGVQAANQPPIINSTPITEAVVGSLYSYAVEATDPDGDTLSYSLTQAPSGMAIDASSGLIEWTPVSGQEGTHPVTVEVADPAGLSDSQSFNIDVSPETVTPGEPLNADLQVAPTFVLPGEPVEIQLLYTGGVGNVSINLLINSQPHSFNDQGFLEFNAGELGENQVEVQISDDDQTLTFIERFYVIDETDTTPPQISLHSPEGDSVITAPEPVIATVYDDAPGFYEVFVAERGTNDWRLIGEGQGNVDQAQVAVLDPTLLLNGQYSLVLRAYDANGNASEAASTFSVEGDMKVGHFSVTFEDVSIPVSGIPIVVNRTYDSRQAHQRLDFGQGWSIDYQNVRVHSNRTVGLGWQLNQYGGIFNRQYCVEPMGDPIVSITLPDGDVHRFVAEASPRCTALVPTMDVNLVFNPMPGTHSELAQTDYGLVRAVGGDLIDLGDVMPVDPRNYRLTLEDGTQFELNRNFGIRRIVDTVGNTLTYTNNGIQHSTGVGIDFVRDGQGRITTIELPNGETLNYDYDAQGNLVAFRDALDQSVQYRYLNRPAHYLDEIIDPRGIGIARNEYDDQGRLIAHIDADGNRIEIEHNLGGNSQTIRDRLGNTTIYIYSDRGDVLQETNALGETITRSYDSHGNKLSETNALGETTSWTYDSRGNMLTETNALGETVSYQYDSRGQLTRITEDDGTVSSQSSFNSNGLLTQMTDALGHTQQFGYSARGDLTQLTDALGQVTQFNYDSRGNQVREILPDGLVREFSYDSMGNRLSETEILTLSDGTTLSLTTTMEYDAKGQLVRTTDALGQVTRMEYDASGNETAHVDPLGRRTEYEYDNRGNQVLVRHPDGSIESKAYDRNDQLISETDRLGRVTTYDYDAAGRLIATHHPDGRVQQTQYDAAGRVVREIDARGAATEYEYDEAGRQTAVIDALGNRTEDQYDSQGRRIASLDALGNLTQFQYDALGRLTRTTFADGTFSEIEYDALGQKISETDPAGLTTRFEYDAGGRLTAVINALDQRTEYEYDERGLRTLQRDANGHTTSWTYDALGRVASRTLPGGQTETYQYDAVGNRISVTDFNGRTTQYEYDAMDRQVRTIHPDGVQEWLEFNDADQVVRIQVNCTPIACALGGREPGETLHQYDSRNLLTRIEYPNGNWIEYGYDANGNRNLLRTAEQQVRYDYDPLNRLSRVRECLNAGCTQSLDTQYQYNAVGSRESVIFANGARADYDYDALHRLVELTHRDEQGQIIVQQQFTLGATGHRLAVNEHNGRQIQYQYDALYRLLEESVTDPNGNRISQYSYDAVGNRLSRAVSCNPDCQGEIEAGTTLYSYDANDRLLQEQGPNGVLTHQYDANGNTLQSSGPDGVQTYFYNGLNQLTQAQGALPSGAAEAHYQYDVYGIRTRQIVDGTEMAFLVDANREYAQVIEQSNDQGQVEATYVVADERVSQSRQGTRSTYHADGLGSIRALTNNAGQQTDSYSYEAFGQLEHQTGSTENDFRYTGEQYDPNLGFYYLRARYYNPANGRFPTMDTYQGRIHEPQTLHKYMYVHADPVNGIDPSGMMFLGHFGIGIQLYAIRIATFAAPAMYTMQHIATRLGTSQIAMAIRHSVVSFNSSVYRGVGLHPNLMRLNAGQMFERLVSPAMRLIRAVPQHSIRSGNRVVARADWLWQGRYIIDTKLGQHVSMTQLRHFVDFAARQGGSVTYVTLTRTPAHLVNQAVNIGQAKGVSVNFVSLLRF